MFANILKELRVENKISQAELGKAVGVSQGTVYFWENGVNEPTAGYIVKLAKYFNITTDELLGVETMNKDNSNSLKVVLSYNKLDSKNKKLVLQIMDNIYDSQIENK